MLMTILSRDEVIDDVPLGSRQTTKRFERNVTVFDAEVTLITEASFYFAGSNLAPFMVDLVVYAQVSAVL